MTVSIILPSSGSGEDMASDLLSPGDRRSLSQCLEQLREAEEVLSRARGALCVLSTKLLGEEVHPKVYASSDGPGLGAHTNGVPLLESGRAVAAVETEYRRSLLTVATDALAGASDSPKSALKVVDMDSQDGMISPSGGRKSVRLVTASPRDHEKRSRNFYTSWTRAERTEAKNENSPAIFDQIVVNSIMENMSQCVKAIVSKNNSDGLQGPGPSGRERDRVVLEEGGDVSWQPLFCNMLRMPIFHPEAKIKLLWMVLGFMFISYEAFAIPVYVAFEVEPDGTLFAVVSVVNSYFISDILFQFVSGYMDKEGNVVLRPTAVAWNYMRSWLPFDLVAGIPWEWLTVDAKGGQMTRTIRAVRALRLLRLMRLLRVVKLGPFLDKIETTMESSRLFTFTFGIIRIGVMLLTVCHWSACIWYSIGNTGAKNGDVHDNGQSASWIIVYQQAYPYIGSDKFQLYIYACYFALTTMCTVGYGDISPTSYNEVRFAMLLLLLSSVFFAAFTGTFMNMLTTLNSQRLALAEKKVLLSRYMRWRAVPWRLMRTVRQHLLFLWDANEGYDAYETSLKEMLPPVLKGELCYHIYGSILNCAPFLAWMQDYPICLKYLAERVESIFLERGDHVFRIDTANEHIYMLLSGTVIISRNEMLFDQDKDAEVAMKDKELGSSHTVVFDIPRNKDSVFLASSRQRRRRQRAAQASTKAPAKLFGLLRTGIEDFDSDVLLMAAVELRRTDVRRKAAARMVQRIWRRRLLERKARGEEEMPANSYAQKGLQINRLPSRRVSAPAYFGEACLWQKPEEWDEELPPPYMYSARCEVRSEFVRIPRSAVATMLEHFSPWLNERFEIFRGVVCERLADMQNGDDFREEEGWGPPQPAWVLPPSPPPERDQPPGILMRATQPMFERLSG